jgi:hypothetical protein
MVAHLIQSLSISEGSSSLTSETSQASKKKVLTPRLTIPLEI